MHNEKPFGPEWSKNNIFSFVSLELLSEHVFQDVLFPLNLLLYISILDVSDYPELLQSPQILAVKTLAVPKVKLKIGSLYILFQSPSPSPANQ